MSNYSTFFPQVAGGSTEITDPKKIALSTLGTTSTTYLADLFHTISASVTTGAAFLSNSSISPIFGNKSAQAYSSKAVISSNTLTSILNISGSGYLCNVITAIGANAASAGEQRIVIIADGTTTTFSYDYSSDTTVDNYYQRMIWGYLAANSSDGYNMPNDSTAVGVWGIGGTVPIYAASVSNQPPTFYINNSSTSMTRLSAPAEFKRLHLPRLRFESSLEVKVLTQNLYSGSGSWPDLAAATYYLDNTLI